MKILSAQLSKGAVELNEYSSLENLQHTPNRGAFLWLDVSEYETVEELRALEKNFSLHPLALEDCVHIRQRPKIEDFHEHLFLICRTVMQKKERYVEGDQLGIFLGRDFIITVHKESLPQLNGVLEKIKGEKPAETPSFLLYAIMDAVVDNLEEAVRQIEEKESIVGCDVLRESPPENMLEQIYSNRSNLLLVSRLLRPQSHVASRLAKKDFQIVNRETTPFFEDIYDHTSRALDRIDSLLEMNMGSLSIYSSSVGHRMNEVMKLLTIISTVGVPLTVLVGWYGMNFRDMPEVYWGYGYLMVFLVAVGLIAGTIWFFKRKGWL